MYIKNVMLFIAISFNKFAYIPGTSSQLPNNNNSATQSGTLCHSSSSPTAAGSKNNREGANRNRAGKMQILMILYDITLP